MHGRGSTGHADFDHGGLLSAALRVERADVAVVGAGPAGIAAAVAAARRGAHVVLLDAGAHPGGQIWRHRHRRELASGPRLWMARLEESGATTMMGAMVADARASARGNGFVLEAEQGTAAIRVRTHRLVLATGARERFLPFPGWTLPGVMGIGGAQALLKAGATFSGRRVAIAGTGPLILPVAASLARAGAELVLVGEQAPFIDVARAAAAVLRQPRLLAQAIRHRAGYWRSRHRAGTWVLAAEGGDRLRSATFTDGRRTRSVRCDVLCTGFGLVPNTELARLLGCEVSREGVRVGARQEAGMAGIFCAGESAGIGGSDVALVEGTIAGLAAADCPAEAAALAQVRDAMRSAARAILGRFALRDELRSLAAPDTIVCRCEDVPLSAIDPRWTPRKARLYARVGMGACQGRTCGDALEVLCGWEPGAVRPPVEPMLLSTILADPASAVPSTSGASA